LRLSPSRPKGIGSICEKNNNTCNKALGKVETKAMDPVTALGLLGPQHTNLLVRKYAVLRLRQAPDEDLELYLLQLVQVTLFAFSRISVRIFAS
jgi:hypothetical protein